MLTSVQNLQVLSPAEPADAGAIIQTALRSSGVTVVLEPLTVLGSSGGSAGTELRARTMETGDHLTLLAWGPGIIQAKEAAKAAKEPRAAKEPPVKESDYTRHGGQAREAAAAAQAVI